MIRHRRRDQCRFRPQTSGALTGDSLSAAIASLPDPAVIARLANEFFAALPANLLRARATPLVPGSVSNLAESVSAAGSIASTGESSRFRRSSRRHAARSKAS